MFSRNSFMRFLPVAIALISCTTVAQAQRGGLNHPTMRDRVREITRTEMDRQLLLKSGAPAHHDDIAARQAVMKQIREDFKEMQALNNRMMAEAWSKPTLNYSFVSDMVAHIGSKASRLKLNLNLPQPESLEKPNSSAPIANAKDFRAALLVLDKAIMSFVSNPLFQQPNTIEITQGIEARRDLEMVINLTDDLKHTASKLGKAQRAQ